MLELKLLGLPELFYEGEKLDLPSPKTLGILAYLAMRGSSRERGELLELFWDAGKASNVRFALFKLRDIKGSEAWFETSDKVALVKAVTDIERIESALAEKRFLDALAVWHERKDADKTLLKGLSLKDAPQFTSWLELERSRLEQLYLETLQACVGDLEAKHKFAEALELAHLLLEKDSLNETTHRSIMRLEYTLGNTDAALAQFEACRQALQLGLEVEPLEDTLSLLREIEQPSVSHAKQAYVLTKAENLPAVTKLFGREALLEEADLLLKQAPLLLQGFGGSGKTALAASLAARHLAQSSNNKVLWLQAGDDGPAGLFDAIARVFGVNKLLAKASDQGSFIRALLVEKQISFFVLDDVWNAYALAKLAECMPSSTTFLITSRQRYASFKRLSVGSLSQAAALELLSFHAASLLTEDAAALELCSVLANHAFAVRIAGISLRMNQQTPEALLQVIRFEPHRLTTPTDFMEEGRESITALLSSSLNALPEEAYEAFMGMGSLFTTSVSAELLALCLRRDTDLTEEALFDLQRRGLVERVTEVGSDAVSYRLHDLAYSFAKANNHFRSASVERACLTFVERFQHDFDELDFELSNLLSTTGQALKSNKLFVVSMMKALTVGDAYYQARGHSPKSLVLLRQAIEFSRESGDLSSCHFMLARLGDAYRELQGNHQLALEAFEAALDLSRDLNDYRREIIMLTLIGTTKAALEDAEADSVLEQAHSLALKYKDDKALAKVLEHRGCLAGEQGNYEDSLGYFEEALSAVKRLEQTMPEDDLIRLRFFTLLNLAETEKSLAMFQRSLVHFVEAQGIASKQKNQLWLAYSFQGLAETHHTMQQRDLAESAYQKAFELYEQNHADFDLKRIMSVMESENYLIPERSMST